MTRALWRGRMRRAGVGLVAVALGLAAVACGGGESAATGDRSAKSDTAAARPTLPAPPRPVELVWPTPNRAYLEGRGMEEFIQPTVSGQLVSGLFGSTRNGGRQFHEGIDLFPLRRDARGEAADDIYAAMAGVVRHVSERAGASSYGRYVVLEHPEQSPPVYTLYAHLAEVDDRIRPGAEVKAGERLARMGRSAGGYEIPKDRAHLHFEIGLRMAEANRFQAWYNRRGFGSPNEHGAYNGMNLMGIDPLTVFARHRAGGLMKLDEVFRELPAAVTLRIAHAGEPEFVRRYPSLIVVGAVGTAPAAKAANAGVETAGWEIEFTATGVPVRWRRLAAGELVGYKAGDARIVSTDEALLKANRGRDLVKTVKGRSVPDDDLRTVLEQLFSWKG